MRTTLILFLAAICMAGYSQKKPKINQALSSLEEGNLTEAKTIIDEAIIYEKTKDDPKTWYYRGQIYAALDTANNQPGALEESLKAFDKALELDPEQKAISSVDFTTGSISNIDSKKQGYYAFYYNQAIADYNEEDFAGAATNFETAYFIMPSDTNAILNAAYAASAAGNDEKARENFTKSYEAGSRDKNIFLQLYNYALKEEDFETALDVIQKGRQALPEDTDLMKYEVNLYIQMDRIEEAKKGLEEAIAADPENADLLFTLGVLNEESGDVEGALAAYKKALEIDPEHFNSNFNLGVMSYNKVSELVKEQGGLNYYPGKSNYNPEEKKRYDELDVLIRTELKAALPTWEKLYNLDNTDVNVLQTLSYIYKALGQEDQYKKLYAELEAIQGE